MKRKYKLKRRPFKNFCLLFKQVVETEKVKIHKSHLRDIFALFLGIMSTKTTRLINVSEKVYPSLTNCVKSLENRLSYFLNQKEGLKKINSLFKLMFEIWRKKIEDKCETFINKKILIIDWTPYAKKRARLNKKNKGMEYIDKVYDPREKKGVKGYGAFIGGLLLKDKTIFPIFHRLFSSKYQEEISQNQLELQAIEEAGDNLIVVGDAYFSKKSFLLGIYKQSKDFLLRIKKDILIDGNEHLFHQLEKIDEYKIIWWERKRGGKIEKIPGVAKFLLTTTTFRSGKFKEIIPFTCIMVEVPIYEEPLFIVTSLNVTTKNLQGIINLYNKRWAIDIFIEGLKMNFGIEKFMVRRWEAIKLLCNLVLSIYIIFLLILLSDDKFLMELCDFLRKNSILVKINIGRIAHAYKLLLSDGNFGFCFPRIIEEYHFLINFILFTIVYKDFGGIINHRGVLH